MAGTIDEEVKLLIDKAYDQCRSILQDNSEQLQKTVDFLLANETMSGAQFENVMEGREIGEASATALMDGFEEPEQP